MKKKAERNKTIDFELKDGQEYLDRCLMWTRAKAPEATALTDPAELTGQIIIGDCLEVMSDMAKTGDKCQPFIDLAIIDPPYNLRKNYHGKSFKKTSKDEYRQYTIEWIEAIKPLLKETASIYVCCDWRSSMVIGDVLEEHFLVRNRITWQREKGRGSKANWKNGMEDIWFATVSDDYTFNVDAVKQRRRVLAPYKQDGQPKDWQETEDGKFRDTCPSNFWDDITIPYWSMPENTAHPTQKPEKLIAKLILASSNAGDVVFDPFAGSGTTAVAASKLGRKFVAVEQNELYGAWAQKRLEMASEDASIQGYENGVFWERNSMPRKK